MPHSPLKKLQARFYYAASEHGYYYGRFGSMKEFSHVYKGRDEEYFSEFTLFRGPDGYHFFYIKGDMALCSDTFSYECEQSFGHAFSKDLRNWEFRGEPLHAGKNYWDCSTIQAPRVIEHEGLYYMLYNGVGKSGESYLCAATSPDLDTWEEHPENPLYHPDPSWSGWGLDTGHHRCGDPDVIKAGDDYIVYYVSDVMDKKGIGCASSKDLIHWEDRGPALTVPCAILPGWCCESPVVAVRNGMYYLFYLNIGLTWLAVSEDPYRFESFMPWADVVGADVREFDGRWYIASLPHGGFPYSKNLNKTLHDPEKKGLYLARLEWVNDFPFIRPLDSD